MDDLDEQARELNWSGFLSMRGGMAFGGLAYLLVVGLFVVYYGSTQGDDGTTVEPVIVAVGWLLVALASLGNAVMLRRFVRFWRAVRAWARQQVQRDPVDAKRTRLEAKLTRSGRGRSFGPAAEFVTGSVFLAPFGLVLPYLALLAQLIGSGDSHGGSGQPVVIRIFVWLALAASLLAAGLPAFIIIGINSVGVPVSQWRRSLIERSTN